MRGALRVPLDEDEPYLGGVLPGREGEGLFGQCLYKESQQVWAYGDCPVTLIQP